MGQTCNMEEVGRKTCPTPKQSKSSTLHSYVAKIKCPLTNGDQEGTVQKELFAIHLSVL